MKYAKNKLHSEVYPDINSEVSVCEFATYENHSPLKVPFRKFYEIFEIIIIKAFGTAASI